MDIEKSFCLRLPWQICYKNTNYVGLTSRMNTHKIDRMSLRGDIISFDRHEIKFAIIGDTKSAIIFVLSFKKKTFFSQK